MNNSYNENDEFQQMYLHFWKPLNSETSDQICSPLADDIAALVFSKIYIQTKIMTTPVIKAQLNEYYKK